MDKKEKEELKKMVKDNKNFHYMYTDRVRQDVNYFIRTNSEVHARKAINKLEYLLSLFDKKDIPEWYSYDDLKKDKERFIKMFGEKLEG